MEMVTLCDHINKQNRRSKIAQAQSTQYFMALYYQAIAANTPNNKLAVQIDLQQKLATVIEVIIVGLQEKSMLVYSPALGLHGRISLGNLPLSLFQDKYRPVVATTTVAAANDGATTLCTVQKLGDGCSIQITASSNAALALTLFEHVWVTISVVSFPYHHPEIVMALTDLIGKTPVNRSITPLTPHNQPAMVHTIAKVLREKEQSASLLADDKKYALVIPGAYQCTVASPLGSTKTSLYTLMESMKDMAILYSDEEDT